MCTFNMGTMKRYLLGLIFLVCGTTSLIAQDTIPAEEPEQAPTKQLAKAAFESGYFIADQTVTVYPAKTLEFVIQHDFGTIQDHWSNLWGIWGASNIRLAMSYTINKNLQVGFGTTKNKLLQDFNIKYVLARQYKGGFPVTITAYGNFAINASNKTTLGNNMIPDMQYNSVVSDTAFATALTNQLNTNKQVGVDYVTYNQAYGLNGSNETDMNTLFDYTYKKSYRFSYFLELMFAKRFCKEFSAQVGVSFLRYNLVDFATMTANHVGVQNMSYVPDQNSGGDSVVYTYKHLGSINNNINISFLGRLKVSPQSSLLLSYSQSLMTYTNMAPWPNFGIAWEISTSTHAFQIFMTAANGLLPQEVAMYNNNNPYNGAILFGFNITRLWTF